MISLEGRSESSRSLRLREGSTDSTNLYQYVGNNPASYTDPFGLCEPWPECMFQAWANAGAQRGGALGSLQLNAAAALSAVSEAVGTNDLGEAVGSGNTGGALLAGAALLPAGRVAGSLGRIGAKLDNLLPLVDRKHLSAAAAELRGAQTGFDHVTEVQSAAQGIQNQIRRLNGILGNPHITQTEREAAEQMLGRASRALDALDNLP